MPPGAHLGSRIDARSTTPRRASLTCQAAHGKRKAAEGDSPVCFCHAWCWRHLGARARNRTLAPRACTGHQPTPNCWCIHRSCRNISFTQSTHFSNQHQLFTTTHLLKHQPQLPHGLFQLRMLLHGAQVVCRRCRQIGALQHVPACTGMMEHGCIGMLNEPCCRRAGRQEPRSTPTVAATAGR